MSDFKKIAENALKASLKKNINESVLYPEGLVERMAPELEKDLSKRQHSLGKHPIFPADDESTFEEKIMGDRFSEVAKRYKRVFEVDTIDNKEVIQELMPLVYETKALEAKHKKELSKLAVDIIRAEYDMSEDVVEIHAELVDKISLVGTQKNKSPMKTETQFKNHEEITNAHEEVYKRRFVNAMIQGAAKKCNHMFHLVDDELTNLNPKLPSKYSKLMASADYMYYIIPSMEKGVAGGIVKVQFPTASNPKAVIYAQALVFPVLIHELVKGVMELLAAHGLPKSKRIGEYVISKADFLEAEPWDMRLGPALWGRFTSLIDPDDFDLKHHIFSELVALPVKEFNLKMREIMANTKEGKKIISDIVKTVKDEFKDEEFNNAMNEIGGGEDDQNGTFDYKELLGMGDDEEDIEDGYDFDDLF